MIKAACHCGAVQLEIAAPPETLTQCNCSICRRLGALWAYYERDQVKVIGAADATGAYVWGDRCIEFHHCRTCGCSTHYDSLGDFNRRAVNARLMAPDVIADTPRQQFDGASI